MTLFALLSVFVTSGSQAVYGAPTRDPVEFAARTGNVFGLLLAPVTVLVATVSVNTAANVVSPAYDPANLAPRLIGFRTGALITGVGGVLAVGGSPSAPGKGPFPGAGLVPLLKPLADYGWVVGTAASPVVYVALVAGRRRA